MKVLFIFKSENFLAPIGLCTISGIAKHLGHKTYLCEMNTQNPFECITHIKPDIIAYSSSTGEAKHYIRINAKIKEKFPNIFTILGGPHATFYPEFVSETTLDAICIGEGEGAFVDVLRRISSGKTIEGIPNIVIKSSGIICKLRPLIEDLDSIPFPDYSLLYDNTPMGSLPLKNFITSRGCPYKCSYCFNHAWNEMYKGLGKIIRRHSVDYVIEDIQRVHKKWPLSCVKFYDDNFVHCADEWLEEFTRKYKKCINLPFFILIRADLLTEEIVKLLKYAGCRTISMSIEAGNPEIRNKMLKRNMSDENIIHAHRICEKYGIYTFTNCIIGLPGTKISHDIESLDLSLKSHVDWGEFLQFHPYPKTELGQQTINMGMYTPDYETMHTSYQYKSPLNCFTKREKNIQRNIATLGPVVLVLPKLRNIIIKFLIYFPPNILFTFFYYLAKQYILRKKIYVTKTTFLKSMWIFIRSLRQDIFRHTPEKVS